MKKKQILFSIFIFAICLVSVFPAQDLTVKEIMKQPSIAGMRISGERLSPNGKWVVYLWNAEGKNPRDVYLVPTSGGEAKKILSPKDLLRAKKEKKKADPLEYGVKITDKFVLSRKNQVGNLRWAPDSSKFLFTQNGDIYVLKIGGSKPKRITKTQSFEFSASFLDNDRILFQQSGNIFSINTKDGTLTQISREANSSKRISVFGSNPSKNGEMIAYISSDTSKHRTLYVPNYLPYYTKVPRVRRGWSKQKVYVTRTDGNSDKAIEVKLPKQEGEAYFSGTRWLADNKTLIVDRVDKTHKRRQMFVVTFDKDDKSNAFLIHEEEDKKWIGRISRIIEASPKSPNQFFFSSEKDTGYNHLYLVNLDKTKFTDGKANAAAKPLTKGNWEIGWAKWGNEINQIIYSSTEGGTEKRKLVIKLLFNEGSTDINLNATVSMKTSFQYKSGSVIFEESKWNEPAELNSITNLSRKAISSSGLNFATLTKTTPSVFLKRKWNEPKFTKFSARDGKKVPAKIYFPANFDKSKKHPMVIFVHGAGYLQNVINGWNNYYREFMFNQLLTQKGYVVLDIDYRGSAGYGRDWRTDVYDFLGGKDYTDHIDGIDFMVKNYNIDQKRIGTYGGSYGGFMAAMLVMRAPERIAAAAALRPVMDWKNYYAANPFYTSQRLRSPKENPKGYERSSPVFYADKLQKQLLILHGLVDSNVHAQDSIQLVEKLIRLDKTEFFELMLYPAENHGFQRSTSWEDEYERILALFEKNLR